jgi:hypothetical protein
MDTNIPIQVSEKFSFYEDRGPSYEVSTKFRRGFDEVRGPYYEVPTKFRRSYESFLRSFDEDRGPQMTK